MREYVAIWKRNVEIKLGSIKGYSPKKYSVAQTVEEAENSELGLRICA